MATATSIDLLVFLRLVVAVLVFGLGRLLRVPLVALAHRLADLVDVGSRSFHASVLPVVAARVELGRVRSRSALVKLARTRCASRSLAAKRGRPERRCGPRRAGRGS